MAKAVVARDVCAEKTTFYRTAAAEILKQEQITLGKLEQDGADSAFLHLGLVDSMLNLSSCYMIMNGISQSVLNQKNEYALNDARKSLYKGIIYLEAIVTSLVDAPYSEYEDKLAKIAAVSPAQRYLLIRKMGLTVNLLENAYGDNTKWRWAFVEMEGRYATLTKNIICLRDVVANSDFESANYEPTVRHLKLTKKLLAQAADRYREKYELSTGRFDDFKQGINFLSALRRLHILLGDHADAINIKKKLDTWASKLMADVEKQEKEGKGNPTG